MRLRRAAATRSALRSRPGRCRVRAGSPAARGAAAYQAEGPPCWTPGGTLILEEEIGPIGVEADGVFSRVATAIPFEAPDFEP
ncbi:hypothetical protein Msi02_47660 [Microbispora siamensis]|uniref:Uncharacterized protein n=1 Tax=Microbispora siamensis TaxID=564413 RepID=A0ABQ4GR87_9ACTN|nr:hypothetical protein Msi02_47660 [Microbispora siamensis]